LPKFLLPGNYVCTHFFLQVLSVVPSGSDFIENGTIRIVRVPKGALRPVMLNNKPELFGAWGLLLQHPPLSLFDAVLASQAIIQFKT